ncbi:TolC family protein [Chromobacterium vaccinii]|uniref:TolC family protein n=1 Tax=Chromobacterium vaccinii TaxID=1108595 RepID=UPI00345A7CEB
MNCNFIIHLKRLLSAISRPMWCVLLFLSFGGQWAHAAANDFLQLLRRASYSHPQVAMAQSQREGADGERHAARWQRYPTPSFQSVTPQDRSRSEPVNRFSLEQPIFAGGRIDAGIDEAEAKYTASQGNLDQVAIELGVRLSSVWYEWHRQRERKAVLMDSVQAHQRLRDQISRRVKEGVSAQADLTLAMARLSQAEGDLQQAKSAERNVYAQLVQLAGAQVHYLSAFPVPSADQQVVESPSVDWREKAIARAPGLAKLDAEAAAAAAEIRVKRGQLSPVVSVRYDYDASGFRKGSGVFLQVSAQPGAGLSGLSGVKASEAYYQAARDARRSAELELRQMLDTDFSDYDSALGRIQSYEQLQASSREVAASYARQFVAGRKSWLDVLNAVRESVAADLSIIDAKTQRSQAWWRLRLRAFGLGEASKEPQ